ncbi:MAG TPA: hypothetical protein VIR58_13615 [Acidimicrobiales bacterium]
MDELSLPQQMGLFDELTHKRCSKCRQRKPLEDFNRLTRSRDGRQSYCRECNRAYHYANWDRHMAQIRARTKRRIAAARKLVLDHLRAHPCADCGETDPVVLEFDHLRDKVGNVSAMVHSNELWRLVDEIEKCEVVCANCHRRRTARRANTYRYRATRDS